ncbi:pyridoxal-phosphate dependent enzyme [candidate division KSB1 bacterium]|nr:pyridoxal-phosphate dependent enzyme [candidate division KSB1 bacterium]
MQSIPKCDDIFTAAERIRSHIHRTPVLTCRNLNLLTGAELFFKCENFQKVGAFKFRGATNAVFSLSDTELKMGVTTHSSGNHAAALALAASKRGAKAYIVMPRTAPAVKKAAVESYGAEIIFCEPTLQAREKTLAEVQKETGAIFIHPYNNARVIAGQGTAALELLNDIPKLDYIIAPVGGGGLLSGTALITSHLAPNTEIIAAEPANADDAYQSFIQGKIVPQTNPRTIADGLLTSLGDLTFAIIQKYVHQIITSSEEAIIQAMKLTWERMKIIIEPSSAVPLGALLERKLDIKNKRIGIIISGGNVDLTKLPW